MKGLIFILILLLFAGCITEIQKAKNKEKSDRFHELLPGSYFFRNDWHDPDAGFDVALIKTTLTSSEYKIFIAPWYKTELHTDIFKITTDTENIITMIEKLE